MLVIGFPIIDPVAVEIGPLAIRWYSLAYVAGILFGWRYALRLADLKHNSLKRIHIDDFIVWATLGIILGGRLGYVLFYRPEFFIDKPIEIFAMWKGGMSFHGGLMGVIALTIIYAKKHKINKFILLDLISASAPIGIFLGRVSNFVNSELYGKETDVLWSVIFVKVDNIARHPSQIYEAILEGVILFIIMFLFIKKNYLLKPGLISSLFLIFYSLFRFFVEFFRVPDEQIGFIFLNLTMGQIISLIFLSSGFYLLSTKKNEN